jgi:iron complex transport system permease protein
VAAGAIAGGLLAATVVYLLAYRRGTHGYRLIIIGVGVQAMLASLNTYLLIRANIFDAQRAALWLAGSLNARSWTHAALAGIALAVLLPAAVGLGRQCRMLEMGDEAARALGVSVERGRLALIGTAVGLAAVATACAGPIAFVALAAPQLSRRLTGATGPGVLPAAAMGAVLLAGSDLIAQRALAPSQLPVGVVTSCLGGAYLIWLLGWRRAARAA